MINRRGLLLGLAAATVAAPALAQSRQMPSAAEIERRLEAAPRMRVPEERRVTVREFKRRPELRRYA
ncbi:hypothetical protein KC217_24280, partial [Mycobacterium tuberculosis]|nr:hypothetical protein [Mycobacterium tuberculosis]